MYYNTILFFPNKSYRRNYIRNGLNERSKYSLKIRLDSRSTSPDWGEGIQYKMLTFAKFSAFQLLF